MCAFELDRLHTVKQIEICDDEKNSHQDASYENKKNQHQKFAYFYSTTELSLDKAT